MEDMPVAGVRADFPDVVAVVRVGREMVRLTWRRRYQAALVPIELADAAEAAGGADAAAAMLRAHTAGRRAGVRDSGSMLEDRGMPRGIPATAGRVASFDESRLRRSAQAAAAACTRVERALEILGGAAPDSLIAVAELRLKYRGANLDGLAQLCEPALTKDEIAGRIRRLLALADRRAAQLGIPGTGST